MGAGLPDDNDTEALMSSNFWKIIFGLPIIFYTVLVSGTLFVIRYDSPKFLIMNGKLEEA